MLSLFLSNLLATVLSAYAKAAAQAQKPNMARALRKFLTLLLIDDLTKSKIRRMSRTRLSRVKCKTAFFWAEQRVGKVAKRFEAETDRLAFVLNHHLALPARGASVSRPRRAASSSKDVLATLFTFRAGKHFEAQHHPIDSGASTKVASALSGSSIGRGSIWLGLRFGL